jgi:hypothetical protein
MAEEESSHDIDRVLPSSQDEPEAGADDSESRYEGEKKASNGFKFTKDDYHEAEIVAEEEIVLVTEGLEHQGIHSWKLPD